MSFGSDSSDRTGETEVCNLIREVVGFLLQEYVFRLDVSMDEVPLMDALEAFHDFDHDFEGVAEREGLSG